MEKNQEKDPKPHETLASATAKEIPEQEEEEENFLAPAETPGHGENATEKALRNPLVVKTILGGLNCSSLLKCRLVNKLWLALGTERLLKSHGNDENDKALRIKFCYCEEAGTYIKMYRGVLFGERKTLESFTEFLAQDFDNNSNEAEIEVETPRSSFPCKNFEFKDLNLNHPQIIEFFQVYGSEIKGLRLGFCKHEKAAVSEGSLFDLLLNKAENLECLTILRVPVEMRFTERLRGPFENTTEVVGNEIISRFWINPPQDLPSDLVHLRILRMYFRERNEEVHQNIEREIIISSPNLKEVHVVHHLPFEPIRRTFDYLTSISKGHLITRIEIEPEAADIEMLKKFVTSEPPPRFSHLTLSLKYVDNAGATAVTFKNFLSFARALLNSSKDSLEYFSLPLGERVARFLKSGEIPPLKRVREVRLGCREKSGRVGWPIPIASFNRIFPNALKLSLTRGEVDLDLGGIDGFLTLDSATSASGSSIEMEIEMREIPQITDLEIIGCFTREFWNNLPSTFCNVQKLSVRNVNLLPLLPLIWNFKTLRLKRVKLSIPVADSFLDQVGLGGRWNPSPALIFPGLDAAITGFSEETCKKLHFIYPEILDEESVKELRINSSVLDLEYLEKLHVKFYVPSYHELPANILTVVSGAYAFGPLRMKSEQGLTKVHVKTQFTAQPDKRLSALITRRQQAENVLKPLMPFASVTFKH